MPVSRVSLVRRRSEHELDAPVLVVCLDGWVDAGRVLQRTTRALLSGPTVVIADVDVDMLVDYRSRRPVMQVEDGVNVGVAWPSIEVAATRDLSGRDVLVLHGIEPDRGWRTFASGVVDLAQECNVRMVVSMGAYPAATPHTREVRVSAIGTTPALIRKVGFLEGKLETPAGVQAAIERECANRMIPTVGLWAPVPHYSASEPFPPAAVALLESFARVCDCHFDLDPLITESAAVLERLDMMQAGDDERNRMVGNLESHADTVANVGLDVERLPTGDQLAQQLREFLDDDNGDS